MKRIRASRLGLLLMYAVLTIWAVISLIPLYWVFTTAFQQPNEVQIMPPKFIPTVVSRYLPFASLGKRKLPRRWWTVPWKASACFSSVLTWCAGS